MPATVCLTAEDVNEQQLQRNLQSVGKECFVMYFPLFASDVLSNADAAAQLQEERPYTGKSCRSRVGHARSIIRAGRAKDALSIIGESGRIPFPIREEAKRLAKLL